jgi:4a-hydroxytetrahydrobiopterin dehydratase
MIDVSITGVKPNRHARRNLRRGRGSCEAYDPAVADLLDGAALDEALRRLPDWSLDRKTLVRAFRRRDWTDAVALVNAVAPEAERRQHHPDVCITEYRVVTFRLTTHSKGGITDRDVDLASRIDELAST